MAENISRWLDALADAILSAHAGAFALLALLMLGCAWFAAAAWRGWIAAGRRHDWRTPALPSTNDGDRHWRASLLLAAGLTVIAALGSLRASPYAQSTGERLSVLEAQVADFRRSQVDPTPRPPDPRLAQLEQDLLRHVSAERNERARLAEEIDALARRQTRTPKSRPAAVLAAWMPATGLVAGVTLMFAGATGVLGRRRSDGASGGIKIDGSMRDIVGMSCGSLLAVTSLVSLGSIVSFENSSVTLFALTPPPARVAQSGGADAVENLECYPAHAIGPFVTNDADTLEAGDVYASARALAGIIAARAAGRALRAVYLIGSTDERRTSRAGGNAALARDRAESVRAALESLYANLPTRPALHVLHDDVGWVRIVTGQPERSSDRVVIACPLWRARGASTHG